jgi:hypothetical protein
MVIMRIKLVLRFVEPNSFTLYPHTKNCVRLVVYFIVNVGASMDFSLVVVVVVRRTTA